MVKVIKDLKEGDIAKDEVIILNEQIILQNLYNIKCDSALLITKNQVENYQNAINECTNINLSYKTQISKLEQKLSNKNGWIKGLIFTLGISIITNLITH